MALTLLTRSYGTQYAGFVVVVKDENSVPARLYNSERGGLLSKDGRVKLPATGDMNVYVNDGTKYTLTLLSAVTGQSVSNEHSVDARAVVQSRVPGAGTYFSIAGTPYGLAETTSYVTPTPSTGSVAVSGACELAGWFCSVAAGTITIYDALSATGTPIVPATALAVGPMPIFGAGTTGKLALTTGCFVVLSGAATVRVLVN